MLNRSLFRFVYVFTAVAFVSGLTFGADDALTKEQAVAEFHKLLDSNASTADVMKGLSEWEAKVSKAGIDLGDEGYTLCLSKYIRAAGGENPTAERDAAISCLADFIAEKGKLPESASKYSTFISNTMPQAASEAVTDGEYQKADKLLMVSIDLSDDPEALYAYLGSQLLETEDSEAHEILIKFLGNALANEKLNVNQKNSILAYIYSDRNERIAQKRQQAKLDKFVKFEGLDLDGKKVSVDDYKGKILLVDFWASWCTPCINEMPNVVAAYDKYKDKGFEILGVSLDRADSEEQIRRTMDRLGMDWKVVYDGKYWQAEPAVANGVNSIPAVFLLDRDGKARFTDLHGEALSQAIEVLLAE